MARSTTERGFTLIELMITVAIIAILAGIAVPAFFGESRKQKARSEVGAVFAELSIREQQYKFENGVYLYAAPCPTPPSKTGTDVTPCLAAGTPWANMRVRISQPNLYCSYEAVIGTGTGTNNPGGFTWSSPNGEWFYITATCDMDGDGSTFSTYFTTSTDGSLQSQNEGK